MHSLSMKELANYTGRSLSTFKRDFQKLTDTTPMKWIIDKRLTEANRRLSTGKENIQDVMQSVGFYNTSFFWRTYKTKFGYSPKKTPHTTE